MSFNKSNFINCFDATIMLWVINIATPTLLTDDIAGGYVERKYSGMMYRVYILCGNILLVLLGFDTVVNRLYSTYPTYTGNCSSSICVKELLCICLHTATNSSSG